MTFPLPALEAVVGQGTAKALLSAMAVRGDRPVLAIHGPRWVGRRSLGRAFARALNCAEGGCGRCDSCGLVLEEHPNVRVLAPASEGASIGVEATREALSVMGRRAWGGTGANVVIVENIAALTREAESLFLKATEDRPPDGVFVLVAEDASRLSPPLRSRCTRVACSAVGEEGTREVLRRLGAPQSVADQWAPVAGGRPGIAVALWREGAVLVRESAMALLETISRQNPGAISEAFGRVDAEIKKGTVRTFLDLLGLLVRDAVAVGAGATPTNVDLEARIRAVSERGMGTVAAAEAFREGHSVVTGVRGANAALHLKRMVVELRLARKR